MREVFSSPRLENVEKVAQWLEEQGIPVRITNGRSYHGNRRRHFNYRTAGNAPQAAVWVIHSEDQPRARALMREAGLSGPTTRPVAQSPVGTGNALPQVPAEPVLPPSALQRISRFRRVLLIVIAVIAAMAIWAV